MGDRYSTPPGKLKSRFTREGTPDFTTWRKIWFEEVRSKLPLTIDINVNDFISIISVWSAAHAVYHFFEVKTGIGGVYELSLRFVDFDLWTMEVIGWSTNCTTILSFIPFTIGVISPDTEDEVIESVLPKIENMKDKRILALREAADIFDAINKYFKKIDPPIWFTDELSEDIKLRILAKTANLEEIFRGEPPLWKKIYKLFTSGLTDQEIAVQLKKQPGTISKNLSLMRDAHPELDLFRIAAKKTKSKKEEIT